jgi:hypothetical protein
MYWNYWANYTEMKCDLCEVVPNSGSYFLRLFCPLLPVLRASVYLFQKRIRILQYFTGYLASLRVTDFAYFI